MDYWGEDILDKMQDEGEFASFVIDAFGEMCKPARLKPEFSPALMHDAWESFRWDVRRLGDNMPKGSKPDHFKVCGCAAYWLRRNSPVIALKEDEVEANLNEAQKKWRKFFAKYSRAFLAYHFGFSICYFFEERRKKGGGFPLQKPDMDYIETISYMMKYKSLSPHAMGMIYRSLFVGNGRSVYS